MYAPVIGVPVFLHFRGIVRQLQQGGGGLPAGEDHFQSGGLAAEESRQLLLRDQAQGAGGDDLVQYQKAEAHRPAAAKGGGQEVGIFRPCLPPFFLCHLEDELADIRAAGSLHAQPVQQGHLRGTAVFEKLDEDFDLKTVQEYLKKKNSGSLKTRKVEDVCADLGIDWDSL